MRAEWIPYLLMPGVRRVRRQVEPYAAAWHAANRRALAAAGPLWIALGDSSAQGIGASAPERGYVGLVLAHLRARDPSWRVVNLSRSGARLAEVLGRQVPALDRLGPAALVTCSAGVNDLLRPGRRHGAVVASLPRGLREARAARANALLRQEAERRGLTVADVWAHTGPPWGGRYAADHFHPSDLGHADWAAAFAEALGLATGPAVS
jgi:lysophospholipase L1-like esterase